MIAKHSVVQAQYELVEEARGLRTRIKDRHSHRTFGSLNEGVESRGIDSKRTGAHAKELSKRLAALQQRLRLVVNERRDAL